MTLKLGTLKSNVESDIERLFEEWDALQADWGLADKRLHMDAMNSVQIWDDLQACCLEWQAAEHSMKKDEASRRGKTRVKPLCPWPFQLPLVPAIQCSFNFGKERCAEAVYAIDGSDQAAYEFVRGHKGGTGLASYGWVATQDAAVVEKFPEAHEHSLQLVPADVYDLQNFSLLTFNQEINQAPSTVRAFAALRRTQLEFSTLNYLIDRVPSGAIILLDGFLKAMLTPPVAFIHEIGKKAARKKVIILGVAKSSQVNMWLHFQEYWDAAQINSCWIRPPAPVLDVAYRSLSGVDTNQFLYLGEKGRGIGVPIAAFLNPSHKGYHVIDFNCYDFEAAKPYLNTVDLPEVHAKYFPLTTKDKDFVCQVLAQVAYYSDQVTCLGYPFPTAAAHKLVKITQYDVERVRSLARSQLLATGGSLEYWGELVEEEPHKTWNL